MGVYIKGMEMPVTCCHCPLMGYDPDIEWADGGRETQGAYICVITHELIDNTKREDHCPLVYVQPHGRLIEESKVLDIVSDWCPDDDGSVGKYGDLREMLDEIEALPTIIPASGGSEDE